MRTQPPTLPGHVSAESPTEADQTAALKNLLGLQVEAAPAPAPAAAQPAVAAVSKDSMVTTQTAQTGQTQLSSEEELGKA